MRLLLDTRAALWWLSDDERLGSVAAQLLEDGSNQVLLSAAVTWEVAIKRSLGKLDVPDDLTAVLLGAGVFPLPIEASHAAAVTALPWHHRDPFDRLLVAQALVESAVLLSHDERMRPYGVPLAW